MKLPVVLLLLFLSLVLTITSHARPDPVLNPIRLISERPDIQTNFLKHYGLTDSDDPLKDIVNCPAWFWGSETNNIKYWELIPEWCIDYVKDYMNEGQYTKDLQTLLIVMTSYFQYYAQQRWHYGRDVVVFDLTDTLLSTLPYYSLPEVNYGSTPFNWTKYSEWLTTAEIPAVPYMDVFYKALVDTGFETVIITGLEETFKTPIEANLARLGIGNWFRLAFKPEDTSSEDFKAEVRKNLVDEGYIIAANIGDQWRGLTGANVGERVFKVPNPMYYLS